MSLTHSRSRHLKSSRRNGRGHQAPNLFRKEMGAEVGHLDVHYPQKRELDCDQSTCMGDGKEYPFWSNPIETLGIFHLPKVSTADLEREMVSTPLSAPTVYKSQQLTIPNQSPPAKPASNKTSISLAHNRKCCYSNHRTLCRTERKSLAYIACSIDEFYYSSIFKLLTPSYVISLLSYSSILAPASDRYFSCSFNCLRKPVFFMGLDAPGYVPAVMAPKSLKQVEALPTSCSLLKRRSRSSETLSVMDQQFLASQSTLVPSPRSSMTSYSSQSTLLSELSSSIEDSEGQSEKEDVILRTYTRRIQRDVQRRIPIRVSTPRTRYEYAMSTARRPATRRSSSPSTGSPKPVLAPTIITDPRSLVHPDQLAQQYPNNIYTYGPARGPDPSNLPLPVPDIIITDHSILLSAATRYAWSPRCLVHTVPYHNVLDHRFLNRYSMSRGENTARSTTAGHEIADVARFEEMGGQETVVVVDVKWLAQRKVVGRGCPSCACLCKGWGVAMAKCVDLWEDEEEKQEERWEVVSDAQACGMRRVPLTDRIEEARRMRVRIQERLRVREARSKKEGDELNTIQTEGEVRAKQELGRTKTVRRRRSKFVEVDSTPGNDLPGVAVSVGNQPANGREVVRRTVVAKLGRGQELESPNVSKKVRNSWIKRLLHA